MDKKKDMDRKRLSRGEPGSLERCAYNKSMREYRARKRGGKIGFIKRLIESLPSLNPIQYAILYKLLVKKLKV